MFEHITVTGRRVTIKKMTGREEQMLLRAVQGGNSSNTKSGRKKQRQQSSAVIRKLISTLVVEADPVIDHGELLIGEEFDLLYLIRLTSLGPLYSFRAKCPDCGKVSEYVVDIRLMRRHLLECSDPACPCHELQSYNPEDVVDDGCLSADFSRIPSGHADSSPPTLRFKLPISGLEAVCQLGTTGMKDTLGKWADESDSRIMTKSLAQMIVSLDGETQRRQIEEILDDLDSYDRFDLRDRLQDADPGVDNELEMTCPACETSFATDVEIGGNFFLPKRGILDPWFVSLLRYQREIGRSLTSWTSHSTNGG